MTSVHTTAAWASSLFVCVMLPFDSVGSLRPRDARHAACISRLNMRFRGLGAFRSNRKRWIQNADHAGGILSYALRARA